MVVIEAVTGLQFDCDHQRYETLAMMSFLPLKPTSACIHQLGVRVKLLSGGDDCGCGNLYNYVVQGSALDREVDRHLGIENDSDYRAKTDISRC